MTRQTRSSRVGVYCSVEGCDIPAWYIGAAKGVCNKHYQLFRATGRTHRIIAPDGAGSVHKKSGYKVMQINGVKRLEHVLIAEKALGHRLPIGAVVHHVTEDRADNHGSFKLVICPSQAYHLMLHKRMRDLGISFKEGWPN